MEKAERAPNRRAVTMVVVAALLAAAAFVIGWPMAGWGILASSPVAVFNYVFGTRVLQNAPADRRKLLNAVLLRSLVRFALAVGALLLAVMGGPAFIAGVFVGLLIEMFVYAGELVRSLATGKG